MTERRPRVLHVTRNLPPLVGGMERLNWHIADELTSAAEVHVVGPEGFASLAPESVQGNEVPLRPLWKFLFLSAWRSWRLARKMKPDLVLAGSGLTAPAAWFAARSSGAGAAVYVHGLDVAVRHPVYRAIWHPVLRRMDIVIANSRATADLVRALGVDEARIRIVHPGVALPPERQPAEVLLDFRARHGLGAARLLLSIGRLTTRKGLREFVQHALPDIVKRAPDTLLVVVGEAPTDSLHADVQTRDSIEATANALGIGGNIRFLGVITDPQELANAYQSASIHVFPVRELPGDPEGFGMVAIEAAAHGLPTAAFATGGIVDAVEEKRSGNLVSAGDYAQLRDVILAMLENGETMWMDTAQSFASEFAWPAFGDRLRAELLVGAGMTRTLT